MQCIQCGAETSNPKFCSRSCAATFNNTQSPKRERRKYYCEKCGAEAVYRKKFCSNCNPIKGADWSKRTLSFVRSVMDFHARVRELARKTYSNLDRPQKCANCGYTKHLEICHIKSIQDFPEDTPISVINSPDNLIALCPNCHWELDNGFWVFDFK